MRCRNVVFRDKESVRGEKFVVELLIVEFALESDTYRKLRCAFAQVVRKVALILMHKSSCSLPLILTSRWLKDAVRSKFENC